MRRGSVACRREPTEEEIKGKQMSSEREREIEKRERERGREGDRRGANKCVRRYNRQKNTMFCGYVNTAVKTSANTRVHGPSCAGACDRDTWQRRVSSTRLDLIVSNVML